MLTLPAASRVYLCTVPCDMRRYVEWRILRSSEADEHIIRCNPFSGHLLVFCNRRTGRLRILY